MDVCAANPRGGSSFAIRVPSVRMIRQPPTYVPIPIASAALTITHIGGRSKSGSRCPVETSASAMIPIVFCASFVPCVNATNPPETSWSRRKTRLTIPGERRRTIQSTAIIKPRLSTQAEDRREERRDQNVVEDPLPLDRVQARCSDRCADHAADERVARTRRQAQVPGEEVPEDRADEAAEDDARGHRVRVHDPRRDRRRDRERHEGAGDVQDGGREHRGPRRHAPASTRSWRSSSRCRESRW